MADSTAEIHDEIEVQRAALADNLNALETKLTGGVRAADLRRFVDERPMDALVIALGAGLFIASLAGKGGRPPEYRELNETLASTKDALLALGQQQVKSLVGAAKAGATQG